MFIRVTEKQTLWGYGSLYIVYNEKYPTEVNLDELDNATRITLQNAMKRGIIFEVDENDKLINKKITLPKPVVTVGQVDVDIYIPDNIKKTIQDMLAKNVIKAKKELVTIKLSSALTYALEFEKATKNRATICDFVRELITTCGNIRGKNNMYESLIVDEEVEIVTIPLTPSEDVTP